MIEDHNRDEGEHRKVQMGDDILTDLDTTIFADLAPPVVVGNIFRWCQKEFGRCTGKVYVKNGIHVGWIFLKREQYEDSRETFLHETWITLVEDKRTVITYHEIT